MTFEDTPRRTVRLDDLNPHERRLVLALIDAQRSACEKGHHVIANGVCKYASAHPE